MYTSFMEFKTIIEPFKIKSVEPIAITTPEQRKEFLEGKIGIYSACNHKR